MGTGSVGGFHRPGISLADCGLAKFQEVIPTANEDSIFSIDHKSTFAERKNLAIKLLGSREFGLSDGSIAKFLRYLKVKF